MSNLRADPHGAAQPSAVIEDINEPHAQAGPYAERYAALRESVTAFCRSDKVSSCLPTHPGVA